MKIRKRETIRPIHVMPGDTINLTYREHLPSGELVSEKVVCSDTIDRTMVVDTAIIFDVGERECDELGLSDGIGGVFGVAK